MYNVKDNHKISKTETKKMEKFHKLLSTAFQLFTTQGIHHTSIQDIVDKAQMAKGTFYLYFKDKYELEDYLLAFTSYKLFENAFLACQNEPFERLDIKLVFMIDHIFNELKQKPELIHFIKKDLSAGVYSEKLSILEHQQINFKDMFLNEVKKRRLNMSNPEITLYMIIELVSSTAFASIINEQPLPIEQYKPILYHTIIKMINEDGNENSHG